MTEARVARDSLGLLEYIRGLLSEERCDLRLPAEANNARSDTGGGGYGRSGHGRAFLQPPQCLARFAGWPSSARDARRGRL